MDQCPRRGAGEWLESFREEKRTFISRNGSEKERRMMTSCHVIFTKRKLTYLCAGAHIMAPARGDRGGARKNQKKILGCGRAILSLGSVMLSIHSKFYSRSKPSGAQGRGSFRLLSRTLIRAGKHG